MAHEIEEIDVSSTSTYYEAWDPAMQIFILDVFRIVKGDPIASRSVWERLPSTWHGDVEIVDEALSLNLFGCQHDLDFMVKAVSRNHSLWAKLSDDI